MIPIPARSPLIPFRFQPKILDSGSDSSLSIHCHGSKDKDVTRFKIPIPRPNSLIPVPIPVPFGFPNSDSDSSKNTVISESMCITDSTYSKCVAKYDSCTRCVMHLDKVYFRIIL